MVLEGKYASIENALRGLARMALRERIECCGRRIRRLERKYGTDFDGFTLSISGRAALQQADD